MSLKAEGFPCVYCNEMVPVPCSLSLANRNPEACARYHRLKLKPSVPLLGVKHDSGKTEYHLMPTDVFPGVSAVFRYGANKYAENNWRGGMPFTRMSNAAVRHITEGFLQGEDLDPESQLHHLDHAITDLMMLRWWTLQGMSHLDDRWKGEVPKVAETNVIHKRDEDDDGA